LSGEAPRFASTPVGDGPLECDLPNLAEEPVVVLAPLC
jgi:hypothetical protein